MLFLTETSGRFFARSYRRGVVLLVVIALLALFAAMALSFVFYAQSNATATGHFVQAQTLSRADIEPELLLRYFLSQLIYILAAKPHHHRDRASRTEARHD